MVRIIRAIQDGSFAFKLLNRVSSVKYVPGPENEVNQYLAKHCPLGDTWRTWSPSGRRIWVQFNPIFDRYDIQTIAYVGANDGHTALALNEAFPGRVFHLFEPVPGTFDILVKKTKQHKDMHCYNIAAGSEEEYHQMFVDEYLPASSLLPYQPLAIVEYPFLGKQHSINVQICPLDKVFQQNKVDRVDMLVMDVQGYENEVLFGAKETLRACKIVVSELSLQPLYRESSTFDSVYQVLVHQGFRLQHLINPMCGESRQVLQIDGIFIRD